MENKENIFLVKCKTAHGYIFIFEGEYDDK